MTLHDLLLPTEFQKGMRIFISEPPVVASLQDGSYILFLSFFSFSCAHTPVTLCTVTEWGWGKCKNRENYTAVVRMWWNQTEVF